MEVGIYFTDNRVEAAAPRPRVLLNTQVVARRPPETDSMWRRCWERIRGEEGQNVSEYAVLLVLLVLFVVAAVHAIGMNAQQVINRVNTALMGS